MKTQPIQRLLGESLEMSKAQQLIDATQKLKGVALLNYKVLFGSLGGP